MPVSFRVDDFPGTKPAEFWRHNLDNYRRFEELFFRHDLTLTLGVIPLHTTEEAIRHFRASPTTLVALHGIYHDERTPNEFGEHLTEEGVYQALCSARAPLEGCNPFGCDTYIPPHNSVDRRTVSALVRAGFGTLYGGPETDVGVLDFARSKGMETVRHLPPLYGRTDEMMDLDVHGWIVRHAPETEIHVGLHWTWEWNIGIRSLENFLSRIAPVL